MNRTALAPLAALMLAAAASLAAGGTADGSIAHRTVETRAGDHRDEPSPIVHTISRAGKGRPMRASGGEGTDATVDLVGRNTVYTFDTPLPEGVYRVEVSVEREDDAGADAGADAPAITVEAEARRRVLPPIPLTDGASASCTVWRLSPRLESGSLIRMTSREMGKLTYDDSLTLSVTLPGTAFVGTITVTVTPINEEDRPTTIFLAGDSTVTDQPGKPWSAWGAILPSHLDDRIAVANAIWNQRARCSRMPGVLSRASSKFPRRPLSSTTAASLFVPLAEVSPAFVHEAIPSRGSPSARSRTRAIQA